MFQQVVHGKTQPGDGRQEAEGVAGTVPVVAMKPAGKVPGAVGGTGEGGSVSPLAQRGLDEPFGLAVGARSIGPGEEMLETEFAAGLGKEEGTKAGAVVGLDLAQRHAQAGMIIDGHEDKIIARPGRGIAGVADDAKAGAVDARELLDVEVKQIAGPGPLVAHDRHGGKELALAA
jgi:hypothetical protein